MSYIRAIPRDLFNEANLLKCHGQLFIHLEGRLPNGGFPEDVSHFEVEQDPNSGALYIVNLPFTIGRRQFRLTRPLNSRNPWPLYVECPDDPEFEVIAVYNENGSLTDEMESLVNEAAE